MDDWMCNGCECTYDNDVEAQKLYGAVLCPVCANNHDIINKFKSSKNGAKILMLLIFMAGFFSGVLVMAKFQDNQIVKAIRDR